MKRMRALSVLVLLALICVGRATRSVVTLDPLLSDGSENDLVDKFGDGFSIRVDEGLCERFTVDGPRDLSAAEEKAILLSALAAHGENLVPSTEGYRIRPMRISQRDSEEKAECRPTNSDFKTSLVRFDRVKTAEARGALAELLSRDGILEEVPGANALVVSDTREKVDEILVNATRLDLSRD